MIEVDFHIDENMPDVQQVSSMLEAQEAIYQNNFTLTGPPGGRISIQPFFNKFLMLTHLQPGKEYRVATFWVPGNAPIIYLYREDHIVRYETSHYKEYFKDDKEWEIIHAHKTSRPLPKTDEEKQNLSLFVIKDLFTELGIHEENPVRFAQLRGFDEAREWLVEVIAGVIILLQEDNLEEPLRAPEQESDLTRSNRVLSEEESLQVADKLRTYEGQITTAEEDRKSTRLNSSH